MLVQVDEGRRPRAVISDKIRATIDHVLVNPIRLCEIQQQNIEDVVDV